MKIEDKINDISTNLSILIYQVKLKNKANLNDINTLLETAFKDILNLDVIYDNRNNIQKIENEYTEKIAITKDILSTANLPLELQKFIFTINSSNSILEIYKYKDNSKIFSLKNLGTREAATYTLSKFGIEEHNQDLGKIFCGPPLKESFKKFGLCDEKISKAISFYRQYQSENTIETNEVYSGINEY